MLSPQFSTGFLSGLGLIVAIGAQNAFVLRQGLRGEHLLTVVLICVSADVLLIAVGIEGLGALIQRNPLLMSLSRYGGAAFLMVYAGIAVLRAWHGEWMGVEEQGVTPYLATILACLGFTILNPHVYLDTVVLLGMLANQHGVDGRWYFGIGAACASMLWFFSLAYGARFLVPLFRRPVSWCVLEVLIASVMFGLALELLVRR